MITSSQLLQFRNTFIDQLDDQGMIEYNVSHYKYLPLYFELGDISNQLIFSISIGYGTPQTLLLDCYFHEESIPKYLIDFEVLSGNDYFTLKRDLPRWQFKPEISKKLEKSQIRHN